MIDIHKAPALSEEMRSQIEDLFNFNSPEVVINSVGWFIAAHYRSAYLRLFEQFPNLQVFGEAGAGKSQTVIMLSRLHWYRNGHGLATATSFTPFAIDNKVSTSHSAPAIFEEYKPRYGPALVTGWAYLHGYLVGVLANAPAVTILGAVAVAAARFIARPGKTSTSPSSCASLSRSIGACRSSFPLL